MDYNITYRERNNSIQVIISYKDHKGDWRQKTKQGFSTQKEAKRGADKLLEELKDDLRFSLDSSLQGVTFRDFVEIYESNNKPFMEANTLQTFKTSMTHFSMLNDMPMKDIKYSDIQECINKMIENNINPNTINLFYVKAKMLFSRAVKPYKVIKESPCHDILLPKSVKADKLKALTKSELDDLLSKLNFETYHLLALLASHCGLRLGEMLGLTLPDIDFQKGEINIDKQWKLQKGKQYVYGFGTTKTKNSIRTVPMPRPVAVAIKKYVEKRPARIDRRIFKNTNNSALTIALGRRFRELGYDISIHSLRHTYVTLLIEQQVDYKTIAELIGDNVEMVYKVYGHVNNDMRKKAVEKIDNIFQL